ncbi:hypothetical protein D9611_004907 [Ephemerocybe angulata]|uniref:Uncharacterized protein n=1 Tax=Ephemerocybe angulata TaxID=980116 RepID=A0A8H5EXF6_9AGAR|nr:hypothetical protein D9611_004907 [Tulosesus angulatus]
MEPREDEYARKFTFMSLFALLLLEEEEEWTGEEPITPSTQGSRCTRRCRWSTGMLFVVPVDLVVAALLVVEKGLRWWWWWWSRKESTLMSNPTYKSVYERSQLFENRAAMFEDKYKRMKTDFEAQKKSMTRRDRLEVKMKESLDTFETISSDMKIMLQGFKSGAETVLSAAGTRSSTPINPLSGFDFPKKPEREDKQNALLWWENCTAPNSGVSTASKGGKKSDVTPYPYVDEKGELVDYLEYRRCRTTIRDVLTRLQQQTPGILVAGWLSNSDTTKEAVMQAVYPKHPWLALADGHYKFHKLVSSVHSEAGRRIKSKVGAAQGGSETPAGSVKKEGHSSLVKREHSEDASCGGGESRPRKKAKAPAPEPDANLACVATAAAHQPEVIDLELASDVVSPRPEGYDFDDGLENSWQQELEYKAVPGSSTSEATLVITSNRGSSRTVLALEAGTSEPASSSKPFSTNKPTNWTPASLQEFTARNYQLAQRPPAPFVGAGFDDPLSAVTLSGVGTVPSHPTASPNPTVSYPTLSSAVRASMLPIDPDLTAGGPTQASADPQDSAEPKSPTVASALPSIANGFTEPPQLPPLPVQRATAKDKENRAPKARAAVGQGKFALHNYKKKDTGKAIYAHIWAAIDGNKKLKTSDFNAAWNALSSEAQSHYNNQVGQPGPLATNTAVGN